MEIIKINLIPSGATPVVHVKQYDIGRTWRFELYEGAAVYTLDGTEVLECDVKKLDGNVVTISVTNTSSTYVDIETTVQMTACSGDQIGALRITKGGDDIATINFILACQRSPLEGGITSDSAIHNLEQQIADAVANQYDADSVVFDNAPTPGHGIGYAVTSDGLKSYIPKNVSDMDDVTITTPVAGEALVFDNDGNLVNGTPTLDIDDLSDVTITTPTDGEILVYNNGTWENQANPSSTTNFAPDYDDTATYNTNDKVIYQGLLYVCLEDSVTGAWDSTKWQQISTADYTATLLPIESGSATNTKDYIDNRTAYASDITSQTTWLNSFDVAAWGSLTVLKSGNMVVITVLGLKCTNAVNDFTNAIELPSAVNSVYSILRGGDGTVIPIRTAGKYLQVGISVVGVTYTGQIVIPL